MFLRQMILNPLLVMFFLVVCLSIGILVVYLNYFIIDREELSAEVVHSSRTHMLLHCVQSIEIITTKNKTTDCGMECII